MATTDLRSQQRRGGLFLSGLTNPALSTVELPVGMPAEILETLSENLQATICGSPEWQARIKQQGQPAPATPAGPFDDFDDDVPF